MGMTEQEKQEKVIKALEICLMPPSREELDNDICSHDDCPYFREYDSGKCVSAVARDALALLKAQEPRVMTWQEVIGAAIECKPLYIEVKDNEDKEPGDDRWAMVTQYKDSITNGMILAMSSYITSEVLFKDWYGKTWRCWTSHPDQATREAIPWNAQK